MEIKDWTKEKLLDRLQRYQELATLVHPSTKSYPKLQGVEYFVGMKPCEGSVGGDHIAIVNFDNYRLDEMIKQAQKAGNTTLAAALKSNRDKFGILVADASGHSVSDAVVINHLDGAFRLGIGYELKTNGEITAELFERINDECYERITGTNISHPPLITMLYGEVRSDGRFRYLSAGHPPPIVFSNEFDRIMKIGDEHVKSSTPLGVLPSRYHMDTEHFSGQANVSRKRDFPVNEITLLGKGDIMILYTDGLIEQEQGKKDFSRHKLEEVLRKTKRDRSKNIYAAIMDELSSFSPQDDDLSIAVVKKK